LDADGEKAVLPPHHVQEFSKERKARRPKLPVRPRLEVLEDRILPSTSPLDPQTFIFTASPPPVPSVAAITSYVSSMMELRSQLIATIEQDLSTALYTVGQEIAQEVSAFEQQVDSFFGIDPDTSNPPDSGSGRGNASGRGSGGGAPTTAQGAPNSALPNTPPLSGGSSGSGPSGAGHT
jgi:hypothetical protein